MACQTAAARIFVTNDGGATWTQQYADSVWPELMQFVDGEHGWMSGCALPRTLAQHCSQLFRTTDAGATWTPLPAYPGAEIIGMAFLSPEDGWLLADGCGERCLNGPAQLFSTSDGGATWSSNDLPPAAAPRSLQRLDAAHAWVLTETAALITRDGGAHWDRSSYSMRWWAIRLIDPSDGWLGCTGGAGGGMAAKRSTARLTVAARGNSSRPRRLRPTSVLSESAS